MKKNEKKKTRKEIISFRPNGPQKIEFQASAIKTVHITSRTELCNPNFGPPKISNFCVCADHTTTIFFRCFPLFGRFRAERTSRSVGNLAVSVSNAPFSPRNSFSALIFGRKHILDPTFGQFSTFIFRGHACANAKIGKRLWVISMLIKAPEGCILRVYIIIGKEGKK